MIIQYIKPDPLPLHSGNLGGQLLGRDEFAENIFKQLEAKPVKPPTVKKIIDAVCTLCDVKEKELSKPGRQRKLSEARGLIAWFVVEKRSATLTSVAKKFERDLSALSVVRKIEERRVESRALLDNLRLIDNSIYQA